MNELLKYRQEIDLIDIELKQLFLKRMSIIKKITDYKRENNISITDITRETEMFHTLLMDINDNDKKYYKEFLSNIIKISKEYQKDNK
ncbi:MAG: chorismate mutase [Bacilli bacterium]|nr:chorismate mutase [Acholeplasmataceae bacterium]MDY2901893.1 chorismate mutase [Bacilli bacterium]